MGHQPQATHPNILLQMTGIGQPAAPSLSETGEASATLGGHLRGGREAAGSGFLLSQVCGVSLF